MLELDPSHSQHPFRATSSHSSKEVEASSPRHSDPSLIGSDVPSHPNRPRQELHTHIKHDQAFFDLNAEGPNDHRVGDVLTYASDLTMSSSSYRSQQRSYSVGSIPSGGRAPGSSKEQLHPSLRGRFKLRGRQLVRRLAKSEKAAISFCIVLSLLILGSLIALLYTHGKSHKKYAHSAVMGATFALMTTVGTAVTIWRKNMGEVLLTVMLVDVTGFLVLQQLDNLLS
jgi:hypothetical protein